MANFEDLPIYRVLFKMNRSGFTKQEFFDLALEHNKDFTESYCQHFMDLLLRNRLLMQKKNGRYFFTIAEKNKNK